jgi:hypothetical protein
MRSTYLVISLVTAVCCAVLTACEKESLLPLPEADLAIASAKAGPNASCFNVKTVANGIDLGCATIASPLDCSGSQPTLSNFGAIPTAPVQFGPYAGYMTSIATGLEQAGNPPTGNGALHITLIHYFETTDGNHAFWTEDQAVCAPGSDPYSCLVNDVLDIVGGCGDFAGATGKLHTRGELRFDGGAELCPLFYLSGGQDWVPTGSLAVNWHGRICRAS